MAGGALGERDTWIKQRGLEYHTQRTGGGDAESNHQGLRQARAEECGTDADWSDGAEGEKEVGLVCGENLSVVYCFIWDSQLFGGFCSFCLALGGFINKIEMAAFHLVGSAAGRNGPRQAAAPIGIAVLEGQALCLGR